MTRVHFPDLEAADLVGSEGRDPNAPYFGPSARANIQRRIDRTARTDPSAPARISDPRDPRVGGSASIPGLRVPDLVLGDIMRGIAEVEAGGELQLVAKLKELLNELGGTTSRGRQFDMTTGQGRDLLASIGDARGGVSAIGDLTPPAAHSGDSVWTTREPVARDPHGSNGPSGGQASPGQPSTGIPDENEMDRRTEAQIQAGGADDLTAGEDAPVGQRSPGRPGDAIGRIDIEGQYEGDDVRALTDAHQRYHAGDDVGGGVFFVYPGPRPNAGQDLGGDDDAPTGSARLAARLLPGYLAAAHELHPNGWVASIGPGANYGPDPRTSAPGPVVGAIPLADQPQRGTARLDPADTVRRVRYVPGGGKDPPRT
jgi:hypothetical protein